MRLAAEAIRTTLGPLLDAIPDGVLIVNAEQLIVFANRATKRIFGHEPTDLFGKPLDLLLPSRVRSSHARSLAGYAMDGQSERGHGMAALFALHADGHEVPVDIALSRAVAFGPTMVMALVRDGADREKRAREERALEQSTQQFRLLAEVSHDALYSWTPAEETHWLGDGVERFLGYPPLQKTDRVWWAERLHPDDRDQVVATLRSHAKSTDSALTMEYRFRRADDSYAVVVHRSISTRGANGDITQVFGALLDITELRSSQEAERALAHSQSFLAQRLHTIVESMPAACIVSDAHRVISYVNPAATQLFGTSASRLLGTRWPDDYLRVTESPSTATQLPGNTAVTLELQTPAGRHLVVEWTSASVQDPPGADGLISMLQDLTANRALQLQVMQSQKMEAMGRMAGGVAHDFNNLLSAILTSSDLLLDSLSPQDPRREDAEEIQRTAVRATNLTRQLLALSRRESGALRVISLNETLHNIERLLRRLVGEQLHVVVHDCAEPLHAFIDPTRFEQVLINLAVNARDAMPPGGTLEIGLHREATYGGRAPLHAQPEAQWACVTVHDSGAGISAEVIEHIFEPFFTTKDAEHGTGLGLSICLAIAHEAGGSLEVDSDPGTGTTFSLRLPLAAPTMAPHSRARSDERVHETGPNSPTSETRAPTFVTNH